MGVNTSLPSILRLPSEDRDFAKGGNEMQIHSLPLTDDDLWKKDSATHTLSFHHREDKVRELMKLITRDRGVRVPSVPVNIL
ncbi:unnamed protein product [Euphydryas editha]|uniref:Uncharacterized protein n=1 Tax=Euphydryas editha TaxID=104508 RepID=A0AAU9UUN6_EUPED|nr:unnamed protein product [Euphydryas editha]